ncbi:MAG: hypothetical protein WCG76_01665 [Verrucomicrobiota bacterium]
MKIHRAQLCTALLFAGAFLVGCKDKDAVKFYRVSKGETESPAPQASETGSGGMGSLPPMGGPAVPGAPSAQPSQVTGTPPANWEAQPLSSMRQASYLVKGDNGAVADISLVALGGAAGGVLDNVNRWLTQLGRPAVTGEELAQKAQHVAAPLGDVTVVDLQGLPESADPAKDGRIIAGIATTDGQSWFFKMRGNAALAGSQKEGFIQWIGTVKVGPGGGGAEPAIPADHPAIPADHPAIPADRPAIPSDHPAIPSAPAAPDAMSAPAAGPEKEQIKWEVPANWKPAAPKAMRYAGFAVAGQNGETADISVSVFGGDGGGELGNVNRWRSQIGLGEVDAGGLKPLVVPVAGKDSQILTVDMVGPKGRILAGWAKIGARTWFFKLAAPDALAGSEKAAFAKFLGSVQFQP